MAKIFGQLEYAQLHVLASDGAAATAGLIYWNSVSGKAMIDDATNIRALLRNDQKAIVGNNGTANNNVRFHRGASGVLQFVQGGDATAEGTLSTSLAQISAKQETYTNATRPSVGNAGRIIYNSDEAKPQFDNGSDWFNIGSGSGGGVNYILANDGVSVTGWNTYADAAGVVPVDGTGGSPALTFTSSASSPLRGTKSFLITKDAANRQGEGVSYDFTIDAADKNKTLAIKFDMEASSAFVVGDAADLRVFIYDITNATLIYPDAITMNAAIGSFAANFVATSSTSYRLIFHVATTNASAWTVKLDNVQVGPSEIVKAPAMSDWIPFTPTSAWTATHTGFYRRVGDSAEIKINITCTGAVAGSLNTIGFSQIGTIDTTKLLATTTNQTPIGRGAAEDLATQGYPVEVLYIDANNVSLRPIRTNGTYGDLNDLVNATVPFTFGAGDFVEFTFTVPISGWSTNVVAANSQVIRMSNVLANGTRVTGTAPTQLGQYRSYLRNSSARSYTETNGSPSAAPSVADGIAIYTGNDWTTADTNNQPTRYDIYIGKNKTYELVGYQSSGRSGYINFDPTPYNGSSLAGIIENYNTQTGILSLTRFKTDLTFTDAGAVGLDENGTPRGNAYFDIIVSDNPVAVQYEPINTPVGSVLAFAGVTAPNGYLLCNGATVSRETYRALHNVIGNAHGNGDGSTTFHLPDYRGRFLRGADGGVARDPDRASRTAMNSGGNTGDNIGSIQDDAFESHFHSSNFSFAGTVDGGSQAADPRATGTINSNSTGGSETRPVNAYVNYIIKY